jgi:hypothetical protein
MTLPEQKAGAVAPAFCFMQQYPPFLMNMPYDASFIACSSAAWFAVSSIVCANTA